MLIRVLSLLLAFSIISQPVLAFGFMDDSTQEIIHETWSAQTFSELKNGVISIPEEAINDYLTTILPDHPEIRSVQVAVHPDNRLNLAINTKQTGRMKLDGRITRFVQNNEESTAQIVIGERKMLDKPITSLFFAHISLGMLTKLFGNPLNNDQEQFTTRIDGNTLSVNFKPYVDQSPLKTVSLYGMTPAELFSVDSITTDEGMVYLHTSYHGPSLAMPVLQRLFDAM